jgi:CubicO group peptidase (beta-lactamase class C family)
MFKQLLLAIVAAAAASSGFASAQIPGPVFHPLPCDQRRTPVTDRMQDMVAAVNVGGLAAIGAAVDRNWSSAAAQGRAGAELDLARWSLASDHLEPDRICADGEGAAVGEFRNALTGAVDRVRFTSEDGSEHRLTGVFVREGFRIQADRTHGRPDSARAAALDSFLREWSRRDLFSGVVLIAHNGAPIYWQAHGLANRETQAPFDRNALVNLASMNKIFTATAVMQLVERGQLRLDETIEEAAPNAIAGVHGRQIQIRHLLSHTSGLTDSADREHPFAQPGQTERYANLNYELLGEVIAAVTHMRYEDYFRLHVFGPAGMANTDRFEMSQPTDALAMGYTPALDGDALVYRANPLLHTIPGGAMGGYFSSAGDLLKFATALTAGRLVSANSLGQMRAVHTEIGAEDYGFGIIRWRGPNIWGNAGDLPGTDADLEIYGDTGYVAIVLANRSGVNPPVLAKIRSLFYPQGATGAFR